MHLEAVWPLLLYSFAMYSDDVRAVRQGKFHFYNSLPTPLFQVWKLITTKVFFRAEVEKKMIRWCDDNHLCTNINLKTTGTVISVRVGIPIVCILMHVGVVEHDYWGAAVCWLILGSIISVFASITQPQSHGSVGIFVLVQLEGRI